MRRSFPSPTLRNSLLSSVSSMNSTTHRQGKVFPIEVKETGEISWSNYTPHKLCLWVGVGILFSRCASVHPTVCACVRNVLFP